MIQLENMMGQFSFPMLCSSTECISGVVVSVHTCRFFPQCVVVVFFLTDFRSAQSWLVETRPCWKTEDSWWNMVKAPGASCKIIHMYASKINVGITSVHTACVTISIAFQYPQLLAFIVQKYLWIDIFSSCMVNEQSSVRLFPLCTHSHVFVQWLKWRSLSYDCKAFNHQHFR